MGGTFYSAFAAFGRYGATSRLRGWLRQVPGLFDWQGEFRFRESLGAGHLATGPEPLTIHSDGLASIVFDYRAPVRLASSSPRTEMDPRTMSALN